MPMTYAMSMLSEVMTDTVRTDMVTSRIKTVTNHNNTIRINFDSNHNVPRAAITMNEAATTQMRGAMKIAAQSVVAFCP